MLVLSVCDAGGVGGVTVTAGRSCAPSGFAVEVAPFGVTMTGTAVGPGSGTEVCAEASPGAAESVDFCGGCGKSQGRGTRATGMILRDPDSVVNQRWSRRKRRTYQVAAQTTPWPWSCCLIMLYSVSMNWEMYRTKGMISRTPPSATESAVRKFTTACATDGTFCERRRVSSEVKSGNEAAYIEVL